MWGESYLGLGGFIARDLLFLFVLCPVIMRLTPYAAERFLKRFLIAIHFL